MTSSSLSAAPVRADYLIVQISQERFALAGEAVREVIRWRAPTPIPAAPALLLGLISQRGLIVPVLDARILLGLPAPAITRAARLVLARHEADDLALLVDGVADLVELDHGALAPPPPGLDPQRARLLSALTRAADQPLAIINLGALVAAAQAALGQGAA